MSGLIKSILQNIFRKPVTRNYPAVARQEIPAYRGRLNIDINACIFCSICAKKCPVDALKVNRAEKTWSVDPYRCILCGYCLEGCPKKCLSMSPNHHNEGK